MFILTTTPIWAIVLLVIGSLMFLIGGIITVNICVDLTEGLLRKLALFLGLIVIVPGFVMMLLGGFNIKSVEESFNNPYSVSENKRSDLRVETSEIEAKAATALNVDKVQIELKDDSGSYNARKIINGDMVDFVAVEEGKISTGYFYFTESTIEVLTTGENDLINHTSIATK